MVVCKSHLFIYCHRRNSKKKKCLLLLLFKVRILISMYTHRAGREKGGQFKLD